MGGFVYEHGASEAGETSVVKVSGAPVIVISCILLLIRSPLRKVVQQPSLSGSACADDSLEVAT